MIEATPREKNLTVSYSLPLEVVRAIEYRAFRDRTSKSEAVARLVREAVAGDTRFVAAIAVRDGDDR